MSIKKTELKESFTINLEDVEESSTSDPAKKLHIEKIITRDSYKGKSAEDVPFIKTVFNLVILSFGLSNFVLAYWVQYTGIFPSLLLIFIGAAINLWSYYLLTSLYLKYRVKTYEDLVLKVYGKKFSIFLSVLLQIFTIGLIMTYHVVIYKLIGGIINIIGNFGYKSLNEFLEISFWRDLRWKSIINFGFTCLLFIPVCLMKSNKIFNYTSMLGVISVLLLTLIIIFQFPWYFKDYLNNIYDENKKETHLNYYDMSEGFKEDFKFIQALVIFVFNYTYHNGLIPILSVFKDRKDEKKTYRLNDVSVLVNILTYIFVTTCGYLTQPYKTPELIIERRILWKNDTIMMFGWLTLIITGLTKIPINYYNLRISFFAVFGKSVDQISNITNILFTVIVLFFTTLMGTVYQKVISYFSLMGSFCSMMFAMLIPALLYFKGMDMPYYHWKKVGSLILGIAFSSIGFTSGIYTIKDMFK